MPTYDYQCPSCGTIKEDIIHSITEINNPSKETLLQITCNCEKKGVKMNLYFGSAPSIKTPTRNRFLHKDRKKRNHNHFKKEILPTLDNDSKKHHFKKLGIKS
jgi:hypothetical protein